MTPQPIKQMIDCFFLTRYNHWISLGGTSAGMTTIESMVSHVERLFHENLSLDIRFSPFLQNVDRLVLKSIT